MIGKGKEGTSLNPVKADTLYRESVSDSRSPRVMITILLQKRSSYAK